MIVNGVKVYEEYRPIFKVYKYITGDYLQAKPTDSMTYVSERLFEVVNPFLTERGHKPIELNDLIDDTNILLNEIIEELGIE